MVHLNDFYEFAWTESNHIKHQKYAKIRARDY